MTDQDKQRLGKGAQDMVLKYLKLFKQYLDGPPDERRNPGSEWRKVFWDHVGKVHNEEAAKGFGCAADEMHHVLVTWTLMADDLEKGDRWS